MLSKNYSVEFKWRFTDGYNDGATITMMQYEFGLTKSTVKLWRERTDQGGVGTIDRPRKNWLIGQNVCLLQGHLKNIGQAVSV